MVILLRRKAEGEEGRGEEETQEEGEKHRGRKRGEITPGALLQLLGAYGARRFLV